VRVVFSPTTWSNAPVAVRLIVQCPSCRSLVAVDSVVVDGRRSTTGDPLAGVRCEACGALTMLPIVEASAPAADMTPPESSTTALSAVTAVRAPIAPTPFEQDSPATPSPLATPTSSPPSLAPPSTFGPDAPALPPDVLERIRVRWPAPTDVQAHLAERFERLLENRWSEPTEHTALVKSAAADGELAFLGQRYRAVLDVVPNEPRARAAQGELLTLATAMMTVRKVEAAPDDGASGWKVAVAVATFLVVGACAWWLLRPFMWPALGGRP
jgi:hypothetical protein